MQLFKLHSAIVLPMSIPSPISVVLLAGGHGTRMRASTPKQFLKLKKKIIALHSFELFASIPQITEIIVVADPAYHSLFPKTTRFAHPGKRRQDSVYNGLNQVSKSCQLVCIHDSARPLLSKEKLEEVLKEGLLYKAAALAVPVKNTIKESDPDHFIKRTLDRSVLWEMHTPQVATPELLYKGFEIARKNNLEVTDDTSLVELTGHRVKLVTDSYKNIKITTPEDLVLAELYLSTTPP